MQRLVLFLAAVSLFSLPAAADAGDLVLRNLDISIGVGHPDRRPAVVYVDGRHDRDDHRHHKGRDHHRHWKKHQRPAKRMVVIDRHRRHCDAERVVVKRPGKVVVIADARHR